MRSIFLILTVTTSYAFLRGWPGELHPVLRTCLAVLVLVLGIGMWRRRIRPRASVARSVEVTAIYDHNHHPVLCSLVSSQLGDGAKTLIFEVEGDSPSAR